MALITAQELAHLIHRRDQRDRASRVGVADDAITPPLVIVDVRFYLADHGQGRREYTAGHLPGAVFADLHHDLADTSIAGAGRHPLPPPECFAEVLDRLGIGPDTTVVAYDDHGGAMASRLWWMLTALGHRDVRVLDGGLTAWTSAGLELETSTDREPTGDPTPANHPTPTNRPTGGEDGNPAETTALYPVPTSWPSTITADEIGEEPPREFAVVDSRAANRYRGDVEPIDPRAGHIPGAVNRFHGDVVDADGYFRTTSELSQHFAGLGTAPVVYCGSGVTACHNLLAMTIAGIDDAVLFPGSWSQWSTEVDRPIATGDDS